jgi:hypothetical protein
MPITKSLSDISQEIAQRGLAALFLDTCAVLDIIRCAARREPRVVAIVNQVMKAQAAGEVLLYGPSILSTEAARNRVEVESYARREATKIDHGIDAHRDVAAMLGVAYPYGAAFSHETLVPSLIGLHDQLLNACVHAVTEPTIEVIAFRRAGIRRRPAKGGGGANDCLMFEEFRSIAGAVPAAPSLVLLTVNTDDFLDKEAAGKPIHPDITSDLVGTSARVCMTWPEAASKVLSPARLALI